MACFVMVVMTVNMMQSAWYALLTNVIQKHANIAIPDKGDWVCVSLDKPLRPSPNK